MRRYGKNPNQKERGPGKPVLDHAAIEEAGRGARAVARHRAKPEMLRTAAKIGNVAKRLRGEKTPGRPSTYTAKIAVGGPDIPDDIELPDVMGMDATEDNNDYLPFEDDEEEEETHRETESEKCGLAGRDSNLPSLEQHDEEQHEYERGKGNGNQKKWVGGPDAISLSFEPPIEEEAEEADTGEEAFENPPVESLVDFEVSNLENSGRFDVVEGTVGMFEAGNYGQKGTVEGTPETTPPDRGNSFSENNKGGITRNPPAAENLFPVETRKNDFPVPHLTAIPVIGLARKSMTPQLAPKRNCDSCDFGLNQSCPYFRAGTECQFLPLVKSWKFETFGELEQALLAIAEQEMRRAQTAIVNEELGGGSINEKTSRAMDAAFNKIMLLREKLMPLKMGNCDDGPKNPILDTIRAFAQGLGAGITAPKTPEMRENAQEGPVEPLLGGGRYESSPKWPVVEGEVVPERGSSPGKQSGQAVCASSLRGDARGNSPGPPRQEIYVDSLPDEDEFDGPKPHERTLDVMTGEFEKAEIPPAPKKDLDSDEEDFDDGVFGYREAEHELPTEERAGDGFLLSKLPREMSGDIYTVDLGELETELFSLSDSIAAQNAKMFAQESEARNASQILEDLMSRPKMPEVTLDGGDL